jgi:hypothetical protein
MGGTPVHGVFVDGRSGHVLGARGHTERMDREPKQACEEAHWTHPCVSVEIYGGKRGGVETVGHSEAYLFLSTQLHVAIL